MLVPRVVKELIELRKKKGGGGGEVHNNLVELTPHFADNCSSEITEAVEKRRGRTRTRTRRTRF